MYIACKELSDLGHGPNKSTATIIGEYITVYHDGALIFLYSCQGDNLSGSDTVSHTMKVHHCIYSGQIIVVCLFEF